MRHFLCRAASPVFVKLRGMSAIRINVNIARGKKTPSKSLKCSEIRGPYKMFYQHGNDHSATISYLSEGHTNVIVSHAKRALSF